MAKRVFFSFHYQDVIDFRANVVRRSWLTKADRKSAGFYDASIWEDAKLHGPASVKKLIDNSLSGSSNTAVLIGTDTYSRRWVRYEICKSLHKGNHILGIHINSIKGKDQRTKYQGPNPFDYIGVVISSCGTKVESFTEYDLDQNKWVYYKDLKISYQIEGSPMAMKYRGNNTALSEFYSTYDWISHDGYNNFSNWLR